MKIELLDIYVPMGMLIAVLALCALIITAMVFNLVFIIKIKKAGKATKAASTTPSPEKEVISDTVEQAEKENEAKEEPTAIDNNDTGVLVFNDNEIMVKFNRSFTAKLIQATDKTKELYADIKNYLLSFKGVKCRISWKAATFNVGRKQIAKLTIKGKTLNVNLALSPAEHSELSFNTVDNSQSKAYASVPLGFKVKSNRGVNNAKKLIDEIVKALGLMAIENTNITKASDFPYEETKSLISKGLIKVKSISGEEVSENDTMVSQPFSIHNAITAQEAREEISDEVAMTLVVEGGGSKAVGKKYAVNIDVLSSNFNAGDTVDIELLKEKEIVPQKETAIKILARGSIDKPLTVIADDYSADAIKMIVLVGGTAKLR